MFQVSCLSSLQAGKGRSEIFVKAIDDYGLGVASTLNASTTREARTKNLMMRIDRALQVSPL